MQVVRRKGHGARKLLTAMAAVSLLAAACGGDSKTDSTSKTTTAADAEGTPVAGGEATFGMVFDAFGLEPTTLVGGVTDGPIGLALYDPLMLQNLRSGQYEPWLAQSVDSTDKVTWTIKLRDGVKFHDGTPLDADAVKLNIDRHKDPANKSRAAANAANIESVTVTDPKTVTVKLKFPWSAFPEILTSQIGLMASPTAIKAGTANTKPVGTGPFTFSERVPADHTTVVKNPSYWRPGEPYLEKIIFRPILDDATRQASVEKGEIQGAQSIQGNVLAAAKTKGLKSSANNGNPNVIMINTKSPPFDDVRVRQAIQLATDTNTVNNVIYEGSAPATVVMLDKDNPFYAAQYAKNGFDAAKAKTLVSQVEAEKGPITFAFSCYNEPSRVKLAQLVQQMWQQAGMDVTLKMGDQQTLVTDVFKKSYAIACFSLGNVTDPDLIYYPSMHSKSPTNYSNYSNPEVDAALDKGRTSADQAERKVAYTTVQKHVVEDVPVLEYAASPWGWITGKNVNGTVADNGGAFRPGLVWIKK